MSSYVKSYAVSFLSVIILGNCLFIKKLIPMLTVSANTINDDNTMTVIFTGLFIFISNRNFTIKINNYFQHGLIIVISLCYFFNIQASCTGIKNFFVNAVLLINLFVRTGFADVPFFHRINDIRIDDL